MTLKKRSLSLILFVLAISFLAAEQRVKPKDYKELTTPGSPSYVPIPYPKNREEVIQDLFYYIKEYNQPSEDVKYSSVDNQTPISDIILCDLIEPNPTYKITEVTKAKNRMSGFAHDYYWLINVEDLQGNVVMRVTLDAHGLYSGSGAIGPDVYKNADPQTKKRFDRLMKPLNAEDVKSLLSVYLGRDIPDREIKKMEQVAFPSRFAGFIDPAWEIKMRDGTCYYYFLNVDSIFMVEKKIPWKKNALGNRPDIRATAKSMYYLPDTIDDELIILQELPKKK